MLGDMGTVLVVEDESRIAGLLRRTLERDGHTVIVSSGGHEALRVAAVEAIDLVILDLRLPDVPGEDVARELRRVHEERPVPILMLTAKASERDRIAGLEAGADDYVTKPFSPREVSLRVQAILRRARREPEPTKSSFGNATLVIDSDSRTVEATGRVVALTPSEWDLLETFTARPGRVWSRYELITRLRGHEFDGYERTIDSHVKNLRRKIEPDPRRPVIIETVTGVGYRLGIARDR
jgi:DNA-binding response OmpR family regulator